jgi:uncharacterized protein
MKWLLWCGQTQRSKTIQCLLNARFAFAVADLNVTIAPMFSITSTQLDQALGAVQSSATASEAHGCLCGALCGKKKFKIRQWLDELLPDDVKRDAVIEQGLDVLLQSLYTDTTRAIRGTEMEFMPLLPDDDSPLAVRTQALAQWCQGFLYGFGVAGGQSGMNTSAELREILADFARIARASVGDTEPTEEDESDYTEIVEYIRAGVQLVHDESHAAQITHLPGGTSDSMQ